MLINRNWASLLGAVLMTMGAVVIAWQSGVPQTASPVLQDQTVRAFMDLGTSTRRRTETKRSAGYASTECVPCREAQRALTSGRIPSQPPPHPSDAAYARITGRSLDFRLPAAEGRVRRLSERPAHGWVMMLAGPPLRQTICYAEVTDTHLTLSRFSGALSLTTLSIALQDAVPPATDHEVRLLIETLQLLVRFSRSLPHEVVRGHTVEGVTIVSVQPDALYAIPVDSAWRREHQDDVHGRLLGNGRFAHLTRVRASGPADPTVASRVVWFPDYDLR